MSIWADQQIRDLNNKVKELDERLQALEAKEELPAIPEPLDKRTKEWQQWKNANSSR